MPYTPNNDPYIPGDPYGYDLKWMIRKLKEMQDQIDDLEERVEALEEE